jgi:beta-glucosidase
MKNTFKVIVLVLLMTSNALAQGTYDFQPAIEGRAVNLLNQNQLIFKDLNKNKKLDIYEDWRQSV